MFTLLRDDHVRSCTRNADRRFVRKRNREGANLVVFFGNTGVHQGPHVYLLLGAIEVLQPSHNISCTLLLGMAAKFVKVRTLTNIAFTVSKISGLAITSYSVWYFSVV
jgi:hypothetical protein